MQNCEFYNNRAVNGGSISWTGNNGKIDNCLFENSTATGVGGAIYIGGINNTISNCQFYNSTSLLSDVIYADRNRKNLSFINNTIGGLCYIVDGSISNIDVDYLYYSHTDYAYGNIPTHQAYKMNIVPFIFKAIVTGVTNNNDYFKYNSLSLYHLVYFLNKLSYVKLSHRFLYFEYFNKTVNPRRKNQIEYLIF